VTDRSQRGLLGTWHRLLDATGLFAGLLIAAMCVGICADITLRLVGAGGIPWMLEAVEYVQYVMVLVGSAWVLATGAHVAIDAVLLAVPAAVRLKMERGASAFGALVAGIFTAACVAATIDTFRTGSVLHKSFTLPEWIPVAVLTLGFLTLTVEFAIQAAGWFEERETLDL